MSAVRKNPPQGFNQISPGERCLERLYHFWCKDCKKWWSIGDAPEEKSEWFCPWCGLKQRLKSIQVEN